MIVSLKVAIKELEELLSSNELSNQLTISHYMAMARLLIIVKHLDQRVDELERRINDSGMAQALSNAPGR